MPKQKMGEDLEDLVSKAVRPDQRLKAEDLVASELATAILSEPLSKIRHTCEALMLLDESERKSANITEEEVKESEKIYTLTATLRNAFIDKFTDSYGNVIERSATIPWPFERKEVEEWLDWSNYPIWKIYVESGREKERVLKKARELHDEGKPLESLYHVAEYRVTIDTLNRLKVQFVNYAMPRTAKLLKKIISLVSSSSFQEALKRLKGGSYGSQRQG
ncbi:hypothetical protein AKJ58_00975 [candidate division MSBL1 archaeon SCGC-AAA385D11]|uniref:Uncharacterized protein n=1 Tax=candidate division MSBL1 archaeon SCGC-AAA385D11 TaxID=1698286 RepID=A0A133VNQ7_9EURY|nr:hypothetical protein AKJ58_00975 [candidate division MSBL1 archaeon SCGC-AAA385D11]